MKLLSLIQATLTVFWRYVAFPATAIYFTLKAQADGTLAPWMFPLIMTFAGIGWLLPKGEQPPPDQLGDGSPVTPTAGPGGSEEAP